MGFAALNPSYVLFELIFAALSSSGARRRRLPPGLTARRTAPGTSRAPSPLRLRDFARGSPSPNLPGAGGRYPKLRRPRGGTRLRSPSTGGGEPAHFTDELQRGGADLLLGRRRLEIEQRA